MYGSLHAWGRPLRAVPDLPIACISGRIRRTSTTRQVLPDLHRETPRACRQVQGEIADRHRSVPRLSSRHEASASIVFTIYLPAWLPSGVCRVADVGRQRLHGSRFAHPEARRHFRRRCLHRERDLHSAGTEEHSLGRARPTSITWRNGSPMSRTARRQNVKTPSSRSSKREWQSTVPRVFPIPRSAK